MNNKKVFFGMGILILSLIVSSHFVDTSLSCSIVTTCPHTDIFHISNETNAHAELNNNSNYDHKICCNDTTGLKQKESSKESVL